MKKLIINALGRTQRQSVIKSLGLNISSGSKADMTAVYQQAAEWQTEGICGVARKRKRTVLAKRGQC